MSKFLKILVKKIREIFPETGTHFFDKFTEKNRDLDGCSFERREDGAYITYTPPGGADPVIKKLGSLTSGVNLLQYISGDTENSTQTKNYTVTEKAFFLICAHGGGKSGSSLSVNITQVGNCQKIFEHVNRTNYVQLINTNIQMWELDIGSKITVTVYSNDLAFKLINIFKIQ